MPDFKTHDNIDRDVIEVSRDTLLLKLKGCKEFYSSAQAAWGFSGLAVTFFSAAFLTQTFANFWVVPGETLRAAFIMLGIVCAVLGGRNVYRWWSDQGKYDPETIVNGLLKDEPFAFLPAPREQKAEAAANPTTVSAPRRKKERIG